MNRQRCNLILLSMAFHFCLGISISSAQNLTPEWIEKMAAPLVKDRIADGLSIGYIEGENFGTVHLGTSNETKKPANNLTVYEIGSISKVFTSLLLADAVVREKIDLETAADIPNPAGIRLPSFEGTPIQWIDLSTHRSGLPRLPENMPLDDLTNPYSKYDSKKAAVFLNPYELTRKPGTAQEYSNLGASVLGYLVAKSGNKSYSQLLQERIAKPLRMTDCTIDLSDAQKKRFATPHKSFGSTASPWTFADLPGAGGIRATIRDMMRFARAQLDPPQGKIGEAIELAWKQHRDADASAPAMGLGWMIASDGQTRWHNGGTGGYRTAMFVNRETKCAVVVLCNTAADHRIDELAMKIMMKAAGQDVGETFAKLSPFTAVRWQDLQPEVKIEDEWYALISLNDVPADEIVSFSRKTFAEQWKKRFGEDLVELLTRMGHPPDDEVKLVVRSVTSEAEKTLDSVPMTAENRAAIKTATQNAMENNDDAGQDAAVAAIDAKHRARLVGRYQLAPNFVFTVRDRDGHLLVGITNQPTQEVFPDSPAKWSYRGVEAMLEFKLTKTGKARSLILHQNGIEQTARRIR